MARRPAEGEPRIAAIIPAYNEAPRIQVVLESVVGSGLFQQVIVVDDGSEDETQLVAAAMDEVSVVCTPRNLGKGGALQTGMAACDADIVCTIDADLVGLTDRHLADLIRPLLEDNDVAMTVGQFVGGRKRTDWAQGLVKWISGQRALRRSFVETLPDLSGSRFGVETLITKHAKEVGACVMVVPMEGVTQVMKEEKLGLPGGVRERLKMYADIAEHKLPFPVRKSIGDRHRD